MGYHDVSLLDLFQRLLKEGKYEYVLDRACVQFEPDHAEYITVSLCDRFNNTLYFDTLSTEGTLFKGVYNW